jgi:hypothetical protein
VDEQHRVARHERGRPGAGGRDGCTEREHGDGENETEQAATHDGHDRGGRFEVDVGRGSRI